MFYCENCYLLNEENTCAFCGSRLTRGPKMDDYCFIGNKCSPWAEMYIYLYIRNSWNINITVLV